jgi:hypothetical protein
LEEQRVDVGRRYALRAGVAVVMMAGKEVPRGCHVEGKTAAVDVEFEHGLLVIGCGPTWLWVVDVAHRPSVGRRQVSQHRVVVARQHRAVTVVVLGTSRDEIALTDPRAAEVRNCQ